MRAVTAILSVLTLQCSGALAQAPAPAEPLSPGKPAGLRDAALTSESLYFVIGLAAMAGVAVVLATSNAPSASSTGTSP
jgi:hypothetical protein